MYLCLVAIFKNESHILKEWLDHYIKQGVDKFLLIDNGSNDNYFNIIKPYIMADIVHLVIDPTRYKQEELYNIHYLNECRKYTWVIICDLDEFIYARKGFATIKTYLESVEENVSQIHIPWKMFGSCGYDKMDIEQPESVIKSFTKRTNYDKNCNFQGVIKAGNKKYSLTKCIVRTKFITKMKCHSHITTNSVRICTDSISDINSNDIFSGISENILNEAALHLNHYAIQSYEWFMRVKAMRGDVHRTVNDNVRDEHYFRRYDGSSSDIYDTELATMY